MFGIIFGYLIAIRVVSSSQIRTTQNNTNSLWRWKDRAGEKVYEGAIWSKIEAN